MSDAFKENSNVRVGGVNVLNTLQKPALRLPSNLTLPYLGSYCTLTLGT